jgi:hypothetical protein
MWLANEALVSMVRDRLPMRYYSGEAWWSLQIAVALTRMCDTVEAEMVLMNSDFDVDGQTLFRSLYEQVVTLPGWRSSRSGPAASLGLTAGSMTLATSG